MYRESDVTKESRIVVVAGRNERGEPVVREVRLDADGHVIEILGERLAGGYGRDSYISTWPRR